MQNLNEPETSLPVRQVTVRSGPSQVLSLNTSTKDRPEVPPSVNLKRKEAQRNPPSDWDSGNFKFESSPGLSLSCQRLARVHLDGPASAQHVLAHASS